MFKCQVFYTLKLYKKHEFLDQIFFFIFIFFLQVAKAQVNKKYKVETLNHNGLNKTMINQIKNICKRKQACRSHPIH